MNNIAIIGASWGDEAKARCAHYFSPNYRYIVRFSGSNNAGHTIYVDGVKIVFNQVPCIDFRDKITMGFLGAGMVINMHALADELVNLEKYFPNAASRITVDPDAFVVLEKHIEEDKLKNAHIGSTGKGIGPAYADKISRSGTKVRDFLNDNSEITQRLQKMGVKFKYVLEMYDEFLSSEVLFEGAQGVLLDINAGIYPYVSCGDSTLGGIYSSGFGFIAPKKVYGIAKVYTTKVGNGPFPTEYFGEEAEALRKLGNEYGSVTGRPRRVGALDLPSLRYAKKKGGITHLILTKFDILNNNEYIKVCNRYEKEPVSGHDFFTAKPEYVNIEGWNDPKDFSQVENFIDFVEKETLLKVEYMSCGVTPDDFIKC